MSLEKKQEEGALSPTTSNVGQITDAYPHDAVFGEITEDGPNYRNVRYVPLPIVASLTNTSLGRMAWNSCSNDEDPDRSGCPLTPCGL